MRIPLLEILVSGKKKKEYVSSINNQVPMQNLLQVKHQVSVKITSSHTKSFAITTVVVFKYLLLTGTSVKLITERHCLSSQVHWDEGLGGIDWSR